MSKTRKKMSLSLTGEAVAAIEEEQAATGVSASEAVRRALSLYRFVRSEERAGGSLFVADEDGQPKQIKFVW